MTVSTTVLTVGLLTLTVLVLTFNNRSLRKTLQHEKEDTILGLKERDTKIDDCQAQLQKEKTSRSDFEQRALKVDQEKVALQTEVDKQKGEVVKLQKTAAEAEEKKKAATTLTKENGDLKKQLDEALKRATEADKVKADLQAKLTEAQTKQKEAETAAAAAKEEAAKAKA